MRKKRNSKNNQLISMEQLDKQNLKMNPLVKNTSHQNGNDEKKV